MIHSYNDNNLEPFLTTRFNARGMKLLQGMIAKAYMSGEGSVQDIKKKVGLPLQITLRLKTGSIHESGVL